MSLHEETLLIIDMQPGFKSSNDDFVREGCLREIQNAMLNDNPIIFLEYRGKYGSTWKELLDAVNLYYHRNVVMKTHDGGGREVNECIEKWSYPKKLRVCGVNSNACVKSTVEDLVHRFDYPMENFTIVGDAMNLPAMWDEDENNTTNRLKSLITDLDDWVEGGYNVINAKNVSNIYQENMCRA